eukprot:COSAG05_NODE_561_length_8675_cov_3.694846_2_plen_127_part_00
MSHIFILWPVCVCMVRAGELREAMERQRQTFEAERRQWQEQQRRLMRADAGAAAAHQHTVRIRDMHAACEVCAFTRHPSELGTAREPSAIVPWAVWRITPAILGGNKEVQEFVEIRQIPASVLRLE